MRERRRHLRQAQLGIGGEAHLQREESRGNPIPMVMPIDGFRTAFEPVLRALFMAASRRSMMMHCLTLPVGFTTVESRRAASRARQCRIARRTPCSDEPTRTSSRRQRRCGRLGFHQAADPAHRNRCATRLHPSRCIGDRCCATTSGGAPPPIASSSHRISFPPRVCTLEHGWRIRSRNGGFGKPARCSTDGR